MSRSTSRPFGERAIALTKRRHTLKLSFLLIVYTLVSLLAAAAVLPLTRAAGRYVVDEMIYPPEKIMASEKKLFDEFMDFIDREGLTLNDRRRIMPWFRDRNDLIIAVYNGGRPFGDRDEGAQIYSNETDALAMYELLQGEYAPYWYTCPVMPHGDYMRTKAVKVMYYPMYSAGRYADMAAVALAFAAFALCLTILVKRKTAYMALLSRELSVMESGDLTSPVTVKGNDEITVLAEGMDDMRLSFIERLQREENMSRSSRELMTAMSHDLRTPLTALMGYLDILDSGKAEDAEKAAQYIRSAKERAYQLKGMTDELFEYFLVYSAEDEKPETELLDVLTLIAQLWEESAFTLESEDYQTEFTVKDEALTFPAAVNALMLRRVFDNMVSNIRKYADKTAPVRACLTFDESGCVFTVCNRVRAERTSAKSSGIGLASCRKILQLHGGSFESAEDENGFTCRITLPKA